MLAVVVAGFIRVGVCPACLFLWEWDNNKQQQHNMKNENMNMVAKQGFSCAVVVSRDQPS